MDYANLPDASARGLASKSCADLNAAAPDSSAEATLREDTELKRKLINFDQYFQQGWVFFHRSLYYVSSIKKTWKESRQDCLERGADLVVIDSREEQDFTRKFMKLSWIGLTASETTWTWVDGTQLTENYWGPGEPNNYEGKIEDCVEIRFHSVENSWNDSPCEDHNFWICEKSVDL
ncbi:CD209 antigen-like protein A isoform 2-T2 [Aulostomus maculatus]